MALIKCPECGMQISTQADRCPHCGAPAKKKTGGCALLVAVLFGVVLVVGLARSCSAGPSSSATPAIAAEDEADRAARFNAAKAKFEASIAAKYQELLACQKSGDLEGELRLVRQFENLKRLDYQAVAVIAKDAHTADDLARLAKAAPTDFQSIAACYGELHRLYPENAEYAAQAAKSAEAWKLRQITLAEEEKTAAAEAARRAARQARIERQFSPWDGSHRALEEIIKKSMNDPDSYKHVETKYGDYGDYILVETTFRGKNAFGGVVKNWVRAKFTLDGDLIEIVAQGP